MGRRRRADEDPATTAALDQLVRDVATPAEMEAVFRQLKQRLAEQVLAAELTAHLGYPAGGERPDGDARNGTTPRTVLTDEGALPLAIPRDRDGSFTPQFVPKGVRRLPGLRGASGAPEPAARRLERAQGGRPGAAGHLSRAE